MGEAVEVVIDLFADVITGVEDGDLALVSIGELDGREVLKGWFILGGVLFGIGFLGVNLLARVCGWRLLLLLCAWWTFVLVVVDCVVRLAALLTIGILCNVGSSWQLFSNWSCSICWLTVRSHCSDILVPLTGVLVFASLSCNGPARDCASDNFGVMVGYSSSTCTTIIEDRLSWRVGVLSLT